MINSEERDLFQCGTAREHREEVVIDLTDVYRLPGKIAYKPGWPGPEDPMLYSEVLEWLSDRREAYIGSSYYYLRSKEGNTTICRLNVTGGCLYSIEEIDHCQYGIAEEDIDEAMLYQTEDAEIPDHYSISTHIEKKLRTLMDI